MGEYKAKLERLYSELGSTLRIAEVLGVSSEKVRKDMHRLGLPIQKQGGKRKFHPDSDELRLLYQSMTMKQIAEKYGVGETTIWSALKALGIKHETYGDLGHRHRPREFSEIHLERMSTSKKGKFVGEKNGNWKGGLTQIHLRERGSRQYKEWRKAALELRGNACQGCGAVDGRTCECCWTQVKLHVHHLVSFAKFPDRRFDPENSEILCPKCHWQRHYRKIG